MMSVKNLRNKFNQNCGTVPYNPPGLSYEKSSGMGSLTNNNDRVMVGFQRNGIGGPRTGFKTIREEPDTEEKPAKKNNSFLQSYLTNEITKNNGGGKSVSHMPKFSSGPLSPTVVSPTFRTPDKVSPPSSHSVSETVSKFKNGIKSPPPQIAYSSKTATMKSLTPPTPTMVSKFVMKSPPPMPDPTHPLTKSSGTTVKSPSPIHNNNLVTGANGGDRWRIKYDETETKRKALLTQSQKLLREKSDMERQLIKLHTDLESSNKELSERTLQLSQLRKLSEAMYKEYDQLKQQYELETGTLQKAMERASQWYKQNRELKRRSSALMQKVMTVAPSTLDDLADDTDGNENDTEMEELLKTINELTQEVSRLQAELNKIKLQEFEAQEQTIDLTSELEEERRTRMRAEQELKELKMKHENLETMSRKVVEETTMLHQRFKKEKEEGVKIRNDANKVKSERDVLARQSQLLMMDAASDEKIMKLLFEVEQLQTTLSQERQEHADQLKDLQEKLESQSESEQIELYEEKLKLTEAELLCSQQRAEIAESQVEELRRKLDETKTAVAPPPPPPPPPPMCMPPAPPPPPMMSTPNLQSIKLKTVSSLSRHSDSDDSNAIEDMGNYLGLPPATTKGPQVQNGAIDAIINQIKGGRFVLKATDKETPVKKQEPPPVVNEMMNVLGTLRRHPKRRASFKTAPADVAL